MDKGTDNGDEEDDWHVEYIDPSQEETGRWLFKKVVVLGLHSNARTFGLHVG